MVLLLLIGYLFFTTMLLQMLFAIVLDFLNGGIPSVPPNCSQLSNVFDQVIDFAQPLISDEELISFSVSHKDELQEIANLQFYAGQIDYGKGGKEVYEKIALLAHKIGVRSGEGPVLRVYFSEYEYKSGIVVKILGQRSSGYYMCSHGKFNTKGLAITPNVFYGKQASSHTMSHPSIVVSPFYKETSSLDKKFNHGFRRIAENVYIYRS